MRVLALAGALTLAWLLSPQLTVEARDESTGALVGGCVVDEGDRVALEYRHSIYGRPGREEFDVSAAGLALVALRSPSEAVLEYYAREEPVRPAADGFEIRVADLPMPALRLLAGALGRRTLVCGDLRLPLFEADPNGTLVSLTTGRRPRLLAWLRLHWMPR